MSRKPVSTQIAEAMRLGGRSTAFLWMWDNFDELNEAAQSGRTNWVMVAQKFALVCRGEDYKPDALRKTWQRVVAHKARTQSAAVRPRTAILGTPIAVEMPVSEDDGFEFHDLSGKPIKP